MQVDFKLVSKITPIVSQNNYPLNMEDNLFAGILYNCTKVLCMELTIRLLWFHYCIEFFEFLHDRMEMGRYVHIIFGYIFFDELY